MIFFASQICDMYLSTDAILSLYSLVTAFLSSFLCLRQHGKKTQSEKDITHSLSVRGDTAFLICSHSLLRLWEFNAQWSVSIYN